MHLLKHPDRLLICAVLSIILYLINQDSTIEISMTGTFIAFVGGLFLLFVKKSKLAFRGKDSWLVQFLSYHWLPINLFLVFPQLGLFFFMLMCVCFREVLILIQRARNTQTRLGLFDALGVLKFNNNNIRIESVIFGFCFNFISILCYFLTRRAYLLPHQIMYLPLFVFAICLTWVILKDITTESLKENN